MSSELFLTLPRRENRGIGETLHSPGIGALHSQVAGNDGAKVGSFSLSSCLT